MAKRYGEFRCGKGQIWNCDDFIAKKETERHLRVIREKRVVFEE